MKQTLILFLLICPILATAQNEEADTTIAFKKRVLEATELDIVTGYYTQQGQNASVTGGIGTEELTDFATDINLSIPLNEDDVLTINSTVSAYSSASSSNLDPIDGNAKGSPWVASSGASGDDIWYNFNLAYSHSSDDRNKIYSAGLSFATEYDYTSTGGGVGFVRLLNNKNSEISVSGQVYFDIWKPQYPREIKSFVNSEGNLNADFFQGINIMDESGSIISKTDPESWRPMNMELIENNKRNTFVFSVSFSQILSKTTRLAVFSDPTYQSGWLANPMQRVYFADKANYYIGNAASIPFYSSPENVDVFQLADDIERLPGTRLKFPVGMRLNQYISERFVLRSYYRFYFDDWGINSHTINTEIAIKLNQKFTLYPGYRFYIQSAADYFAPFDRHLSTSRFYTFDFDLSQYFSNQFGLGLKYTDIFTSTHIMKFGLKTIALEYQYYTRNSGLNAHIISLGGGFILDKKKK